MKKIQKRYIYAGIVGAAFFIFIYGIMDFNVFLSLLLTLVIYFGGIFLFKEKDLRPFDMEHVNNYYFLASKCANETNYFDNENIKAYVDEITNLTDQIILQLSKRPRNVEQVYGFFDYYLDITHKILMRYKMIVRKGNRTDFEEEFMNKTEDYLDKIKSCFKKQLSSMKQDRIVDIDNEIKQFERTIGLSKNDIEVGEENGYK